jgi:hypothetical protein
MFGSHQDKNNGLGKRSRACSCFGRKRSTYCDLLPLAPHRQFIENTARPTYPAGYTTKILYSEAEKHGSIIGDKQPKTTGQYDSPLSEKESQIKAA